MKQTSVIILLGIAGLLCCGTATGITFVDGGVSLQGILDDHTLDPVGGSSVDVTTDALDDMMDSYWSINATGGNLSTLVFEKTGFANNNEFGIYDIADASKRIRLFDGAASDGAMALLAIREDGSVLVNFADTGIDFATGKFGYYLNSSHSSNGGLWFSDTSKNSDGMDHMAAYQGKGTDTFKMDGWFSGVWGEDEYILAFEDLKADAPYAVPDYDDFVVMVESVTPIPEPATMVILGLGGLLLKRRKHT